MMNKELTNLRGIDIFTCLLSKEDITVVHDPRASTASFNVKDRVLTFPTFNNKLTKNAYMGFALHETAHAIWTDADAWSDLVKSFGSSLPNILEDCRIEKLAKREFPGSKTYFYASYQELVKVHNFFGTSENANPFDFSAYNFFDRINCYFKVGPTAICNFSTSELKIIKKIENLETMDDVATLCKILKKAAKNKKTEESDTKFNFGNSEDDFSFDAIAAELDELNEKFDISEPEYANSNFENNSDTIGDDEYDNKTDVTSEDEDDELGSTSATGDIGGDFSNTVENDENADDSQTELPRHYHFSGDKSINEIDTDADDADDDDLDLDISEDDFDNSETVDAGENAMKELSSGITATAFIPRTKDIPNSVIPWTEITEAIENWSIADSDAKRLLQFEHQTKKAVAKMVSVFNKKKAGSVSRRTVYKDTGALDPRKMIHYKYDENIFLRRKMIRKGKNHGVVLMLDSSGSMWNRFDSVMKQTILMTTFCNRVGIPFKVYAWGGGRLLRLNRDSNDNYVNGATLTELLSSDMPIKVYKKTAGTLLNHARSLAGGGTPLVQSLYRAMPAVAEFKLKNNIDIMNILFFSDGDGWGDFVPYAQSATTFIDAESGEIIDVPKFVEKTFPNKFGYPKPQDTQIAILAKTYKDRYNVNFANIFMNSAAECNRKIRFSAMWTEKEKSEAKKNMKMGVASVGERLSYSFTIVKDGYRIMTGAPNFKWDENASGAAIRKAFKAAMVKKTSSTLFATIVAERVST